MLQEAEPPAEFPHTVAGAANGAATELFELDPPASDDVVPAPPHCAAAVPPVLAVFPQTVTGAATGALAAGLDEDAPPEVAEAGLAVALEVPDAPQDADDEPTAFPQTFTGAATGALADPLEPDDVPVDPVHCAELAPPVLTELPHTFTGAFTGALAPEADDVLPEPPVELPDELLPDELLPDELAGVVPDELALVPFGLSTDTELLLTLAGAVTGTSAAFEEPGVAAPAEAFAVPDCPAAEEAGWVTGLPAEPIATAFPPTVTGAVTLVATLGAWLLVGGVAADAMPAPSSHAPPVKMPAYRHRLVQVFMKHLL